MGFIENLKSNLDGKGINIVFPEGEDPRILWAAAEHAKDNYLNPHVIGFRGEIESTAEKAGIDISGVNVIELGPENITDELVDAFVQRRSGKIDETRARALLKDPNYLGTMLVHTGAMDGMVSGAVHTTGDTVRPALQIIKTKKGMSRVSGLFIMVRDKEIYMMADCAINPYTDADTLAEIAYATHLSGKQFGIPARIAMLSFSTKGSASSDDVDKVAKASKLIKENYPDVNADGELQFDAAIDPEVARRKAPMSEVAGHANTFIFPDLQSGNIGYKIAQRLGGFTAVGPVLQGLAKPVNDLSRGCTKEEVYQLALITAAQAL